MYLRGDNEYMESLKMEKELNPRKAHGDPNALEILNFRLLQEIPEGSYLKKDFEGWVEDDKESYMNVKRSLDQKEQRITNSDHDTKISQFISFQKAMRILLIAGQCLGLNPVTAIMDLDVSKIRFRLCSWIFLYTAIVSISQTLSAGICVYNMLTLPVSIRSLTCFALSFSSLCTVFIFIQIATKWEVLIKEIFNCNLDQYVDSRIITRCNVSCIVFMILGFVEHVLYIVTTVSKTMKCAMPENNFYENFVKILYPSYLQIGITYNIPVAILIQLNTIFITAHWSFSDISVICISLYLTSILNEINKNILLAADKSYLSPNIWGTLREDYSRATRLVRRFDDVFSGLILMSFASNLFSICLIVFNLLENGITSKEENLDTCHYGNALFNGYDYPLYVTFSLIFTLLRFTTMCLVAASINVASSVPASGLYRVPACSYSMEVQRFLDQVHDDVVALTGLEYFHITKELVLSMAGTILTYELVLLQFKSDDLNNF